VARLADVSSNLNVCFGLFRDFMLNSVIGSA
jgi:hypothetical protein